MCAVRNDDLGPPGVTARDMVAADEHEAGELPVCSCARLEGEMGHACDCGKSLVHSFIYLLGALCRLERMDTGESRHCRDLLVDLRIVLHCAAAERIEAGIHTEVHL